MDDSPTSAIPFLDKHSGERVAALEHARLLVSSQSLGWPGVLVEVGDNDGWEVDDLTVANHYLAMNTDPAPLTFEVKGAHGFRRVTLEPGSMWFCPAGEAFTHRVAGRCAFAAVSIDRLYLDRLGLAGSGEPAGGLAIELHRTYGLQSQQMEHLVRALAVEAERNNPGGLPFVEAVVTALGLQLVRQASGVVSHGRRGRAGLSPTVEKRVREIIDAQLARGISIDELAREANVSPSHFMRAFKQTVGLAPHRYILVRRLERARRLLEQPEASLSDVALQTGFVDQSHFTRAFKQHFGVTPGVVRRRTGR